MSKDTLDNRLKDFAKGFAEGARRHYAEAEKAQREVDAIRLPAGDAKAPGYYP